MPPTLCIEQDLVLKYQILSSLPEVKRDVQILQGIVEKLHEVERREDEIQDFECAAQECKHKVAILALLAKSSCPIPVNLWEKIINKYGKTLSSQLTWKSDTNIEVQNDNLEKLFQLFNSLEENEDVQSVSSNFEVNDEILTALT